MIVPAATTHCYVWYTIAGDPAAAVAAVAALLADIEEATGVAGRVLARRDDPATWMEIYENVDAGGAFERTLAALVRRHDFLRHVDGGRRNVERFAALTDVLTAHRDAG